MAIKDTCGVLVQGVQSRTNRELILMLYRADPPIVWALPCGRREKGETREEAAIREALEEVGAVVRLDGDSFSEINARKKRVTIFRATLLDIVDPTTPREGTPGWGSPLAICTGPYEGYNRRMLKYFGIL